MTVYSESFDKADGTVLVAPDTTVIGPDLSWTSTLEGTSIKSNTFSNATVFVTPQAAALTATGSGDRDISVTIAQYTKAAASSSSMQIDAMFGALDYSGGGWTTTITYTQATDAFTFAVSVTLTDETGFNIQTTTPIATIASNDVFRVTINGSGASTVVTVKVNSTTLGTYSNAEFLAAGMSAPQIASLLPSGTYDGIEIGGEVGGDYNIRLDTFSSTVTTTTTTTTVVSHRLPALSSDVPYLQANDRYQVLACVNRGDSTHPPEFRYWYAGAPSWDESV